MIDDRRIAQFNATARAWEKVVNELMVKPMLKEVVEKIVTKEKKNERSQAT